MPALIRLSVVRTVTGDGVSVSVRRNSEPVTTISSTSAGAAVGAAAGRPVCAAAGLTNSMAAAAPQIIEEAIRRSRIFVVFKAFPPAAQVPMTGRPRS
jgi:hypothetical protein